MTVTTTRCPRCSRPLLGDREVPLPVLVLVGGKADQARRAHVRRIGRPAAAPLAIHDRVRCDLYLARVLEDCRGFVQHTDGTPVTAAERARIELDGRLAVAAARSAPDGGARAVEDAPPAAPTLQTGAPAGRGFTGSRVKGTRAADTARRAPTGER